MKAAINPGSRIRVIPVLLRMLNPRMRGMSHNVRRSFNVAATSTASSARNKVAIVTFREGDENEADERDEDKNGGSEKPER